MTRPAARLASFVSLANICAKNRKQEVFFDRKNKDQLHEPHVPRLRHGPYHAAHRCYEHDAHGVDNPFIEYRDSLSDQNSDKDKYSLILANPPFKGSLDYDIVSTDLLKLCKTKRQSCCSSLCSCGC